MYDYQTYGVFRFKEKTNEIIDKQSILAAFLQTLFGLIWLVLYGIFYWKVDNSCDAPIRMYTLVAFWVFTGAFGFRLLSTVFGIALVSGRKERGALIVVVTMNIFVSLAVTFLWVSGIYFLSSGGLPSEECKSLFYLTLAWVTIGTIEILFLVIIPLTRFVGFSIGNDVENSMEDDNDIMMKRKYQTLD